MKSLTTKTQRHEEAQDAAGATGGRDPGPGVYRHPISHPGSHGFDGMVVTVGIEGAAKVLIQVASMATSTRSSESS